MAHSVACCIGPVTIEASPRLLGIGHLGVPFGPSSRPASRFQVPITALEWLPKQDSVTLWSFSIQHSVWRASNLAKVVYCPLNRSTGPIQTVTQLLLPGRTNAASTVGLLVC